MSDATGSTGPAESDVDDRQPSVGSAPVRYRVRRAPKFRAFLLTGAILGLVIGVLIDVLGPTDPRIQATSSLAFFAVVGAAVGACLAAIIAVLLDRRS